MSIFFPHNLNRVKKDFYLNLLVLMKYLPKKIYTTKNFSNLKMLTNYQNDT